MVEKLAKGLLREPLVGLVAALEVEEFLGDARAFGGGGENLGPCGFAGGPEVVEEAAAAVGGAEEDDRPVAGGEHGAKGLIFSVRDSGGFFVDEHSEGADAPGRGFRFRRGGETGWVWGNRAGSVGVVGASSMSGAVKLVQRAQFSLAYSQNDLICREIRLDFSGMTGTHGLQRGWFGLCFRW